MNYINKRLVIVICVILFVFSFSVYAESNVETIEINVGFKNDGENFKWPDYIKRIRRIPGSKIYRIWINIENRSELLILLKNSEQIQFVETIKAIKIQSISKNNIDEKLFEWENIINKEKLLNISNGSQTVVAVLDTGVDLNNNFFFSQLEQNLNEIPDDGIDNDNNGYIDDRIGWDFGDMDNIVMDYNEHGTMVTSIIIRTSPDCRYIPLKLIKDNGLFFGSGELVESIYYAISRNVDVINLSLTISETSIAIRQAIETAVSSGCIVVAAAGNKGENVEFPASMDETIAVGSLYGAESIANWFSPQGPKLDIVAPGVAVDVISLDGVSSYATGTSFSTPMVSGAVSILISKFPEKRVTEIRAILNNGCRDLGSIGKDDIFGYGALDGNNLLLSVYNSFEKIGFENKTVSENINLQDNYYCQLNMTPNNEDLPKQEWIMIGANMAGTDYLCFYNGKEFIDWKFAFENPSITRADVKLKNNILDPFYPDLNMKKLGYRTSGENLWYCYVYSMEEDLSKNILTIYEEGNIVIKNIITLTIE